MPLLGNSAATLIAHSVRACVFFTGRLRSGWQRGSALYVFSLVGEASPEDMRSKCGGASGETALSTRSRGERVCDGGAGRGAGQTTGRPRASPAAQPIVGVASQKGKNEGRRVYHSHRAATIKGMEALEEGG